MTDTYNPNQSEPKDQIRGLIGDTGPDTFFIADVTLAAILGKYDDQRLATAEAADQLASLYLRRAQSFARGSQISVSYTDRSTNLRKLAAELRAEVRNEQTDPVSGMQSVTLEREGDTGQGEYRYDPYRWRY